MSKRLKTPYELNAFLQMPRLAILMYNGVRPGPTGVPVCLDWDGTMVRMFAARNSPKVARLADDPNVSVLVTNRVGEPEGWVAFDGKVRISDFDPSDWASLLDRVAPRYWDLTQTEYAQEIDGWRSAPEAFVALDLLPEIIRSGA